jgi:hypothetical protein
MTAAKIMADVASGNLSPTICELRWSVGLNEALRHHYSRLRGKKVPIVDAKDVQRGIAQTK